MSNLNSVATRLIHSGRNKRVTLGSVNPVIQRASSLVFDSLEEKKKQHKTVLKAGYFMGVAVR